MPPLLADQLLSDQRPSERPAARAPHRRASPRPRRDGRPSLHAARSITWRSPRRADRAAMRAAPECSTASRRARDLRSRPSVRSPARRAPSSMSIETISSTNSGLPSAAAWMRRGRLGIDARPRQEPLDEPLRLVVRERLEEDGRRVALAAAPGRSRVEQLGPRHGHEQDRRVARPVGNVLDEIEQRRLGPVEVVEDDDERLLAARAPRAGDAQPRSLPRPRRCLGETDELGDARRHHRSIVVAAEGRPRSSPRASAGGRPRRCRSAA